MAKAHPAFFCTLNVHCEIMPVQPNIIQRDSLSYRDHESASNLLWSTSPHQVRHFQENRCPQ